jgi:hypothetical protein
MCKSFLVLFFKKEHACFTDRQSARRRHVKPRRGKVADAAWQRAKKQ